MAPRTARANHDGLTRRRFLGGMVTLACAKPLAGLGAGCGGAVGGAPDGGEPDGGAGIVDGWLVPPGTHLAPARYATLVALFDALIPGDDASPGATQAQAAWYVDQLLGAFDADPPRLFAGGPYSGRHGGADGFSDWQPLTRVEELRWRTVIEGSRGLPEREWNGPVVGLVERYDAGLAALDELARARRQRAFAALALDERRGLLPGADAAFVALAYEHAVEGTYGDPVYGGNLERRGWAAIGYEGDRQPIGYTARQMSHPEEG